MQEEVKVWLEDIIKAISEIKFFLTDIPDYQHYQEDLRTKRAIERNVEIIGEAMTRILRQIPTIQISHARNIVDTRNRIIHGYDNVSDAIIWLITQKYLPILEHEAHELLLDNT